MPNNEHVRNPRVDAYKIEESIAEKRAIQVLRGARNNLDSKTQYSPDDQRQLLIDLAQLPQGLMFEKARVIASLSDNLLLPENDHPFVGFFKSVWQTHEDLLKAQGKEYEIPVLPGDPPKEAK